MSGRSSPTSRRRRRRRHPLAYLLAMAACLLIGLVVASFAARLPSADR